MLDAVEGKKPKVKKHPPINLIQKPEPMNIPPPQTANAFRVSIPLATVVNSKSDLKEKDPAIAIIAGVSFQVRLNLSQILSF
mmetsp:Transcript_6331/g.11294  ORF Transcript_6331/g.11294 Transcript_6331/m.11294 type:complete len:82 (+) Transcript_6331:584-829(+)